MIDKDAVLKVHHGGKLTVESKVKLNTPEDLALAYTPGVAIPCLEIAKNKSLAYEYTTKSHMVLVVSDGTAVLGLGDIGPDAAMPVMEGKALLLKQFAGIDAFPICLNTKDVDEIVTTIERIAPSCGAINLEDISAPRCLLIERRLQESLDIPVFHDDQHGTAIVVGAGLLNASRLLKKPLAKMRIALSGVGAAGSSVARHLKALGVKEIFGFNKDGVITLDKYDSYDFLLKELLDDGIITTPKKHNNSLSSIIAGSNVFIGLSAPNIVSAEDIASMAKDSVVFAMANPIPEIMPDIAKRAGARIIGTGRSDFCNQINNVLAFPGIFKGALKARSSKITESMKLAASYAISKLINDQELREDYIIPSPFDKRVVEAVAEAVCQEAIRLGLNRI